MLPEGDAFALQGFAEPSRHRVPAGARERRAVVGEEEPFLARSRERWTLHAHVAGDGVAGDRLHRHEPDPGLGLGPLAAVDDEVANRIGLRGEDDVPQKHRPDLFRAKAVELDRDDREGAKTRGGLGNRAEDRADVLVFERGRPSGRRLRLTQIPED